MGLLKHVKCVKFNTNFRCINYLIRVKLLNLINASLKLSIDSQITTSCIRERKELKF